MLPDSIAATHEPITGRTPLQQAAGCTGPTAGETMPGVIFFGRWTRLECPSLVLEHLG